MPEGDRRNLAQSLGDLTPKGKAPASARVLNAWIAQAQDRLGSTGPRLGWLVAATVVSATLQRAVDDSGTSMFLLKGGTLLQYRLHGMSRTTKDIDGLIRGDLDRFMVELDRALSKPWGPLTFVRDQVEVIDVPHRIVKPRRFDIVVQLGGVTWRRLQIEISPDEGHAGAEPEVIPAPSLSGFGLPTPDRLASLPLAYQIAQKVHACTDPHNPPTEINDRARDVVDLLLLREFTETSGTPPLAKIRAAIVDVFASRAADARSTGSSPRAWPTTVTAHEHWAASFVPAAQSAGVTVTLSEAVDQINAWLETIDNA